MNSARKVAILEKLAGVPKGMGAALRALSKPGAEHANRVRIVARGGARGGAGSSKSQVDSMEAAHASAKEYMASRKNARTFGRKAAKEFAKARQKGPLSSLPGRFKAHHHKSSGRASAAWRDIHKADFNNPRP